MSKGRITLPAEAGQEKTVIELIHKWGADAIRDSDGTVLSQELLDLGFEIYSTICIVRADQDYPRKHPNYLPQQFLQSHHVTGNGKEIIIDLLQNFYKPKYSINEDDNPKEWWEVIDRTSGQVISPNNWNYSDGCVTVYKTTPWHEYTVNFLAYQTWDSTSMYNHLTNGWTCDKVISVNPFIPEVYDHLMKYFDRWLEKHPKTAVVRFTTFAYMFMLVSDINAYNCIRDWTGYCEAVSPAAMREFERVKGYRLRSEDFVDNGYFNITYRPPSKRYLDWIDFINEFVTRFAKDLCDRAHAAGKQTAMFWGDHWIGVEPYLERFSEVGIDIHIGATEDGCAVRRITDAPGQQVKELRLYPYFFKDVFKDGNDPATESKENWRKIRRAMLMNPTIDRLGWGGYLSLANKFPHFVDHLAEIAEEFRTICDRTGQTPAWTAPVKVAILNGWGKMRSWINQTGPAEKFYSGREDVMTFVGSNLLECIAGLPIEISFISFRDVLANPNVLDDINVIINEGFAGTAWSGGDAWRDAQLISTLRGWVANGGGFIGIGEPSACECNGRFFQLSDILGVQKETGNSIQVSGKAGITNNEHFISSGMNEKFNPLNNESFVFCSSASTQLIDVRNKHVHIAANEFHEGRSVYMSSIQWSLENAHLLYRAILWASKKEYCVKQCYATNSNISLTYYPQKELYAVANNTCQPQTTIIYSHRGKTRELSLKPDELMFIEKFDYTGT